MQSGVASLTGPWQTTKNVFALGENLMYAQSAGSSAHLTFNGTSIGLVASRGPNHGAVRVLIDGRQAAIVDLEAWREKYRRVVFTRTFNDSGTHTISVVAMGTRKRPVVDVDAFVVIH
jgi:hypothetical protein